MSELTNSAILEQFGEDYDNWIEHTVALYNYVRRNEPLFKDFCSTVAWHTIRSIAESPDVMHRAKLDLFTLEYEEPDPGDAIDEAMDKQLDQDISNAGH